MSRSCIRRKHALATAWSSIHLGN